MLINKYHEENADAHYGAAHSVGQRAELRVDRQMPQTGPRSRGHTVLCAGLLRPRRSYDARKSDGQGLMIRGLTGILGIRKALQTMRSRGWPRRRSKS